MLLATRFYPYGDDWADVTTTVTFEDEVVSTRSGARADLEYLCAATDGGCFRVEFAYDDPARRRLQACADSTSWIFANNDARDCDWVASSPDVRCTRVADDGVEASTACPVACDTCDVTAAPAASPTSCIEDENVCRFTDEVTSYAIDVVDGESQEVFVIYARGRRPAALFSREIVAP